MAFAGWVLSLSTCSRLGKASESIEQRVLWVNVSKEGKRPVSSAGEEGAVKSRTEPDDRLRMPEGLREEDSNLRPSGYEPDELPLLHPAITPRQ